MMCSRRIAVHNDSTLVRYHGYNFLPIATQHNITHKTSIEWPCIGYNIILYYVNRVWYGTYFLTNIVDIHVSEGWQLPRFLSLGSFISLEVTAKLHTLTFLPIDKIYVGGCHS